MRIVVALHGGVIPLYAMEGLGFAVVVGSAAPVLYSGFNFVEDLGAGGCALIFLNTSPSDTATVIGSSRAGPSPQLGNGRGQWVSLPTLPSPGSRSEEALKPSGAGRPRSTVAPEQRPRQLRPNRPPASGCAVVRLRRDMYLGCRHPPQQPSAPVAASATRASS